MHRSPLPSFGLNRRWFRTASGFAAAALLLGTAVAVRAGVNDRQGCTAECPPGTRLSNIEMTEYQTASAANGTFVYVTETCETFCEPVVPCITPNVSVMTAAGYQCQPLAGFNDFDPVDDIDFSFAEAWDEAQALP